MKTQDRVVPDSDMARSRVVEDIVAVADIFPKVNAAGGSVNGRPVNIEKAQAVEEVDDQPSDGSDGKEQQLSDVHDLNTSPLNVYPVLKKGGFGHQNPSSIDEDWDKRPLSGGILADFSKPEQFFIDKKIRFLRHEKGFIGAVRQANVKENDEGRGGEIGDRRRDRRPLEADPRD